MAMKPEATTSHGTDMPPTRVADPVHLRPDPDPPNQNFENRIRLRIRILLSLTKNQFKHLIFFSSHIKHISSDI